MVIGQLGTGLRASAQTASVGLSFEVATVKQVDPSRRFNPGHFGPHVNPAGASFWSMTPEYLITYAYGLEPGQVTGPEWVSHDRFDIETRFPEGTDEKSERRMLQTLLKDRFKLNFHVEKKDLEVHVLVVGKHGEKLTPSVPDKANAESDVAMKPGDDNAGEEPAQTKVTKNPDGSSTADMGKAGTQTIKFDKELGAMHFERSKITMEELAKGLSPCLGRGVHKVVDETGIKGTYQLAWDCPWWPAARTDAGTLSSDPLDLSSLTRSLDALGLKLETRKIMQDVYVIDHVERPSDTN